MKQVPKAAKALLVMLFLLLSCSDPVPGLERQDLGYFTLVDREGKIVTMTARELDPGDQYIGADNRLYEVKEIRGDQVYLDYLETITLPDVGEMLQTQIGISADESKTVGIYHTHNAESYVPSSGTEAKEDGKGDVLAVGKALADALEADGVQTIWSNNSHLPHDGQAYLRSRRTAAELLKSKPVTLFDVHRDATPPEVYEAEIEGVPVTKIRLVVGRQNQNREANLEYAKKIKAVADQQFPGIIEGIFDARGNYNQDLGPKMILLEFGAHTNRLEDAEQAARFLAKVIPAAAGLAKGGGPAQRETGAAAVKSVVWLLLAVAAVVIVFVLIERGRLDSLLGFFRREAGLGSKDDAEPDQ
ncbi:MAG: stage II sporulation protein P [Firmicutes bacterium]|nr:stage II sporulation protein P [Bacillota bacterium]